MLIGKTLRNITKAFFLLMVLFANGCFDDGHYISDKTFIEISREYSPNKRKLILNYKFDQGAFGYSTGYTSVLNSNSLDGDLRPFNLPDKYNEAKWVDNNTIKAEVNIISDIREGKSIDYEPFKILDVTVNPKLVDIPENGKLIIESKKNSPDEEKELIAYRYAIDEKRGLLHISIIRKDGEIPRIGNYFIGTDSSDYLFNAKWLTNDEIQFETNSTDGELAKYYFLKNRPLTKFTIVINDNKYKSKYLWDSDKRLF